MIDNLRTAIAFLTILPAGHSEQNSQPGRAFAYFPLVGLGLGLMLVGVRLLSEHWSHELSALSVLITWVILTGGLHLDGFADACDGLLATTEPSHRLEIMKDPQVGSWAVIGLILLLLSKWIGLQTTTPAVLILPPVLGRWCMVLAAYLFPYARSTGLGAYFRTGLGSLQVIIASVSTIAVVIGWALLYQTPHVLILFFVPILVLIAPARWAAQRLGGGLTGDVYGALCELTELLTLLTIVVLS